MNEFIKRWSFVRGETLELLECFDDAQLSFQPEGDKWQPMYYQFACMARTQLVYAETIKVRKMDFALFSSQKFPSKHDYQTRESLDALLELAEQTWQTALAEATAEQDSGGAQHGYTVAWPDGSVPLAGHVARLAEHERLHHGQLSSYFTLACLELPKRFKNNWSL